ncbi:MAG: hypothetical protein ACQETH_08140 [Candidatus Rifleibacteriota bacterium]
MRSVEMPLRNEPLENIFFQITQWVKTVHCSNSLLKTIQAKFNDSKIISGYLDIFTCFTTVTEVIHTSTINPQWMWLQKTV